MSGFGGWRQPPLIEAFLSATMLSAQDSSSGAGDSPPSLKRHGLSVYPIPHLCSGAGDSPPSLKRLAWLHTPSSDEVRGLETAPPH